MPWLHLFAGIFLWWLVLYLYGFWNWVDYYRLHGRLELDVMECERISWARIGQDARIEWVGSRTFEGWLKAAVGRDDAHPESRV